MLGSLVVAQMEMVACEGLGGPVRHGAGCASALQSAVALSVPRRGGAKRASIVPRAQWRRKRCVKGTVLQSAVALREILRELSLTFLPGGVTYTVEGLVVNSRSTEARLTGLRGGGRLYRQQ